MLTVVGHATNTADNQAEELLLQINKLICQVTHNVTIQLLNWQAYALKYDLVFGALYSGVWSRNLPSCSLAIILIKSVRSMKIDHSNFTFHFFHLCALFTDEIRIPRIGWRQKELRVVQHKPHQLVSGSRHLPLPIPGEELQLPPDRTTAASRKERQKRLSQILSDGDTSSAIIRTRPDNRRQSGATESKRRNDANRAKRFGTADARSTGARFQRAVRNGATQQQTADCLRRRNGEPPATTVARGASIERSAGSQRRISLAFPRCSSSSRRRRRGRIVVVFVETDGIPADWRSRRELIEVDRSISRRMSGPIDCSSATIGTSLVCWSNSTRQWGRDADIKYVGRVRQQVAPRTSENDEDEKSGVQICVQSAPARATNEVKTSTMKSVWCSQQQTRNWRGLVKMVAG